MMRTGKLRLAKRIPYTLRIDGEGARESTSPADLSSSKRSPMHGEFDDG